MQRATKPSKSVRPVYVDNINSEFRKEQSDYNYKTCKNTSLSNIQQNRFERIFNDYPPLLNADDMNALRNRYLEILRNIPVKDINKDNKFEIAGNLDVKLKINRLIKDIASLAAAELLSSNQKVKHILFTFLEVNPEQYAPLFEGKAYQVVSSFVGTTKMHVQLMAKAYADKYEDANSAVSHYINQNITALIRAGMEAPNKNIQLRDVAADIKMTSYLPVEKPVETGIGAAAAAVVVGGVGALLFFGFKALVSGPSGSSGPGFKP